MTELRMGCHWRSDGKGRLVLSTDDTESIKTERKQTQKPDV